MKETLPEGFRIRTIRDEEDIQKAVRLNALIHGNDAGELVQGLCTRHPTMRLEDCFFVEEEATGRMVSFLCLIPLKWSYEGVELKVAELGCVGTLETYRRRGFIRALNQEYEKRMREGEYDLSVIEGIPYFYRQFGYEYAIPLDEECTIRLEQIPEPEEGETLKNIIIRPLTLDDITEARRLLEQTISSLSVHTVRDESTWLHQEKQKMAGGIPFEPLSIESNGSMTGYFRFNKSGKAVSILEVSELNYDEIVEVLRYAKSIAKSERKEPLVRIRAPPSSSFVEVAKCLGGQVNPAYAFQIRIPDIRRFLMKIKPVLEKRIRGSVFRGLTTVVKINVYTMVIELHFVNGHLQKVVSAPPSEERDIRFRPLVIYQLLMGYKSREELCAQYLDCSVRGKMRHMIDVLFPKTTSYIYSGY